MGATIIRVRTGRAVGQYRLGQKISTGGTCVLWDAIHLPTGQKVAVKLLNHSLRRDSSWRARLRREAEILQLLGDLPGVVRLLDFGESQAGPFLALEKLEGYDLTKRPAEPMSPAVAGRLLGQLLLILDGIHSRGIVHCDIKPGNLMQLPDGSLKLIDFSLADAIGKKGCIQPLTHDEWTRGTPGYCSPEQAGGKILDARSDLFSVACLFWELLTSEAMFGHLTIAIMARPETLTGRHNRPEQIPEELWPFLDRAMGRCRSQRFRSAAHMRTALFKILPLSGIPLPRSA